MNIFKPLAMACFMLLGAMTVVSGCVVAEPREGYYDHPHHRWYHEHAWHDCEERDIHCHD